MIEGLEDAEYNREEARSAGDGMRFRSPRMGRQLVKLDCRVSLGRGLVMYEDDNLCL